MIAPIPPGLLEFLAGTGHEVPPHLNPLRERYAAEEEHPPVAAQRLQREVIETDRDDGYRAGLDDDPLDADGPIDRNDRVFESRVDIEPHESRAKSQFGADHRGVGDDRRRNTGQRPGQYLGFTASEVHPGQVPVVGEPRLAMAGCFGLGEPHLGALHGLSAGTARTGTDLEFSVCDPVAGCHEIQLAGSDHLFRTQGVRVQRFALKQPRNGREPDVGMRPHLHGVRVGDVVWPHEIDKAPRTNGPPALGREHAHDSHPAHFGGATLPHLDPGRRGMYELTVSFFDWTTHLSAPRSVFSTGYGGHPQLDGRVFRSG